MKLGSCYSGCRTMKWLKAQPSSINGRAPDAAWYGWQEPAVDSAGHLGKQERVFPSPPLGHPG